MKTKMKFSGEKEEFGTGATREKKEGKGLPALMYPGFLIRHSKWLEMGAVNHSPRNWEQGIPSESFLNSLYRHLIAYHNGDRSEDHLAAIAFNTQGLMYNEEQKPELCDLPYYLSPPLSEISGECSPNAVRGERAKSIATPSWLSQNYEEWKAAMQAQQQSSSFLLPSFHSLHSGSPEAWKVFQKAMGRPPKKITAYLSHPIRGREDGRPEEQRIKENCEDAIQMGKKLMDRFPNLDLYIPAAHDRALQVALAQDSLSIDDILRIDCEILKQQGLLLLYVPDKYVSKGMNVEWTFATKNNIPNIAFGKDEKSLGNLEIFLRDYK